MFWQQIDDPFGNLPISTASAAMLAVVMRVACAPGLRPALHVDACSLTSGASS
jgi:hypothetical protein